MSLAQKIIDFNSSLEFKGRLPKDVTIMNPYQDEEGVMSIVKDFYNKYYNDNQPRIFILGINPGRFGAGLTGIPFTDPKRLLSACNIAYPGNPSHEPSSVFIYEMIHAFGGPEKFYGKFYISAVCPLGFTAAVGRSGKQVNYNYYDRPDLIKAVEGFIRSGIETQLAFGLSRETAICLGTGKNEKYLLRLNKEKGYFKNIVALEHPRYIMQYRSAQKQFYIDKYLSVLNSVGIP
jgi:hypothetical protein